MMMIASLARPIISMVMFLILSIVPPVVSEEGDAISTINLVDTGPAILATDVRNLEIDSP